MTASGTTSGTTRRARAAWRFAHVLMTLAFGTALGACFNPPAEAVLFACDAKTAPSCPDGYTCEADDCCHRDGSDVEAALGSCRIGGAMSAGTSSTGSTSSTSSAGSTASSGPTSTSADTGSSTGADTASSGTGTTT
jgi:hypothetical protein